MLARTASWGFGRTLEDAWKFFTSGEVDVISVCKLHMPHNEGVRYSMWRLHDCFARHRDRVHALTERLWAHQVKQPAA